MHQDADLYKELLQSATYLFWTVKSKCVLVFFDAESASLREAEYEFIGDYRESHEGK